MFSIVRNLLADLRLGRFLRERRKWSHETFGPPCFRDWRGPLDHLKKEIAEVEKAATVRQEQEELVDCVFLAFDALDRCGSLEYREIVDLLVAKLAKNKLRNWGDWGTKDPTKAVEHVRTQEEKSAKLCEMHGGSSGLQCSSQTQGEGYVELQKMIDSLPEEDPVEGHTMTDGEIQEAIRLAEQKLYEAKGDPDFVGRGSCRREPVLPLQRKDTPVTVEEYFTQEAVNEPSPDLRGCTGKPETCGPCQKDVGGGSPVQ